MSHQEEQALRLKLDSPYFIKKKLLKLQLVAVVNCYKPLHYKLTRMIRIKWPKLNNHQKITVNRMS